MASSPTSRTLKYLRDRGYTCEVVERWNQWAKVRQDLFGVIDVVALGPGIPGVIGVQTTTLSNMSARRKKLLESPKAKLWVLSGNPLLLHGWKKGRNGRWAVVEEHLSAKVWAEL